MFETLKTAWKTEDIRKKIVYTLLMVVVFRLGCYIPIPGVNPAYISQQVENFSILGFINLMNGGALGNFTLFAMGIQPYITASIIINLLTVAIPALERMAKEPDGKDKIENITRIFGIALSGVMAIGLILTMGPNALIQSETVPGWLIYVTVALVATAGSALCIWIGDRITEKGIGNGISFLIFAGIASRVLPVMFSYFSLVFAGATTFWLVPVVLGLIFLVILGLTLVDLGERRVPVQYAKRVVGRKMYGGNTTNIPMRVNQNGVMPLIFAATIIQFPGMIAQFWPNSGFYAWYQQWLGSGTIIYMIVYALLIIGFAYFYTTISFNPIEISKNMQQNGGFIPGIRPGRPTSDYLKRISHRLTMFSAVFLAVIAAVPTIFTDLMGGISAFGATSLMILVSVALETSKTIEAELTMRNYKGFLK
ncbi:MAG: preprotein translocase subunit SecY [Christensenellales bacterium]|jgi:preprotein translocase subunit SecY